MVRKETPEKRRRGRPTAAYRLAPEEFATLYVRHVPVVLWASVHRNADASGKTVRQYLLQLLSEGTGIALDPSVSENGKPLNDK